MLGIPESSSPADNSINLIWGGEQSMKNLSRQRSVPTISTQVF